MAKQLTKAELVEQNEALGEQVAGLQGQVEDLDVENDNLAAESDELELRNDALQASLVAQNDTIDELEEELEKQENLLQLADLVVDVSTEYELSAEAKIADLEQDNFHLTIQLAAAKDKIAKLEVCSKVQVYYRKREFATND